MKFFILAAAATLASAHTKNSHNPNVLAQTTLKGITENGKWIPDRYSTGDDDQLMKNLIERGLAFTVDKGFGDNYHFKTIKGCNATEAACICCMQHHTHFWVDR